MACGAEGLAPCDVLDAACQATLADIAACQWGGAGTPPVLPPVTTFTSDEFLARLSEASAGTAAPPAELQQAFALILQWLGLAQPSDLTADANNQRLASLYLAFYDFQTKQATLISDARTGDARVDDELLFHEFVHAQQDARYDLASLAANVVTTDGGIAFRSLVEGEAQFHQSLFELAAFGVPVTEGNLQRGIEYVRGQQEDGWLANPGSAWATSIVLAGYLYGQFMVRDWWLAGGSDAMVAHFADPPAESLRMLEATFGHEPTTERIWAFPANNVFAPVGEPLPMPGDERYPRGIDRLGAWTVYMLARLAGEAELARDLALGWRGDQLDVFQLAGGGVAGRLRVSFDTAAHASDLAQLLSQKANVAVQTNGTLVVAALSEQADKPAWLFGPLESP